MTGHQSGAFLSKADLRRLTGYARYAKQIDWLTRQGIAFYVNDLGEPVVHHSAFNPRAGADFRLGVVD